MKLIPRQKIWLTLVIVANLCLWIIPSNVIEQIARDRQTMLGRYSRTHFYWIVGVGIISIVSFYIDWSTGEKYKRRWFQVIATLLFLVPSVAVVDYIIRPPGAEHYVRDTIAYHRPANQVFNQTYRDKPAAYRTYPNAPSGYGTVECQLQTDARGYRNQSERQQFDIVAIGDSFTEGSNVTDGDPWPRRLADISGLSVYNAGMSGYDPMHYLEDLRETGLALNPKYVICMIYEGNDFRSAKSDGKRLKPSVSARFKAYVKQSPIISAIDEMLIHTFGPIRCDAPVPESDAINWMPLAVPSGENARYYAFAPKQLRDLMIPREEFAVHRHWLNPRSHFAEMKKLCDDAGVTLVLVFAPTTAHVMLPAAADRVSGAQLGAFLALTEDDDFPPDERFEKTLLTRVDAREEVLAQWCEHESIPFLSLTIPLRGAALTGTQVYYTYDQHWTREGHEVAAEAINAFLHEIAPQEEMAQNSP